MHRKTKPKKTVASNTSSGTVAATIGASVATLATLCSSSIATATLASAATTHSGITYGGVLTAATNGSGPWSPVFNPFSPSYNYAFGFGAVYEPLYQYNAATHTDTPWLATAYRWGNAGRVIEFKIRHGVKWSNGQPLTPADVAFTYDLYNKIEKENGGTTGLVSAKVKGDWVVLTYDASQYVNFYTIAMNVPIVPPFTFAHVSDPLKFEDSHPIGTGPFVLSSFDSEYIIYKKNPNYWQKGKPYIKEVEDISASGNATMEALLISHRIDYSGVFTSDIFKTFVNRDPSRNIVYTPPDGVVSLALNLSNPMFQSLALRQAINLVLNRESLDKIGESGAEPPASQSGLAGAATAPFVLSQYKAPVSPNISTAKADLTKAGYKLSGGKLYAPGSDTQVAFSLSFPSSYSDWLTDCSIIKQNLTGIGINLTCDGLSYQEWSADYLDSNFQATFDTQVGPLPYNEYDQVFSVPTGGLPPVGKPNNYTNVERYNNGSAVAALNKLEVTNPTNMVGQKQQVALLENIYVHSLPVIPMFDSTYHEDFVNGPLYGWPSYKDPYMCTFCNAYQEQILLAAHER